MRFRAAGTTPSGPSEPGKARTVMAKHGAEQQALAASITHNRNKASEYGHDHAVSPSKGVTAKPPSDAAGAGTLSESNASAKTGQPPLEAVAVDGALTAKRVNDTSQMLATNQGVAVRDNQNSLKAGLALIRPGQDHSGVRTFLDGGR